MADIYELSIVLNLGEDLSNEEVAELRWHLGLGPKPEILHIVPSFRSWWRTTAANSSQRTILCLC
ncbi:hypothetical protein FBY35_3678 [Streptomyces sp. SLBN-118]|uniref:hypothetical protein n=1 Tax=Streptomyces sp. SLBN-118 TaxID=2768454 RepID=UPI00116FFA76|nr:hypothetical protein [Streptomyces sp. SLBN-118]TQK42299.1 hypothetical protein FBY35_3678 [Streptomyces sp. SLBN-118]